MKKYLLGLLAIPFSLIAFSSANLTVSRNGSDYTPNNVSIDGSFLPSENFSCNSDVNCCSMSLYNTSNTKVCEILYCNEEGDYFECENVLDGDYIIKYDNEYDFNSPFTSISLPNTTIIGGDDNTGGDSGESGELIGQLTPIIDGLGSAMSEFIPYVVYIGLGILGVIIGFVAIKWLMNYVKGKSLGTFNSRRRK